MKFAEILIDYCNGSRGSRNGSNEMENDRTDKQKSEKLREEATKILEKCFGLNKFRKGQWEVIESILNHKNAIAIFTTG